MSEVFILERIASPFELFLPFRGCSGTAFYILDFLDGKGYVVLQSRTVFGDSFVDITN